MLSRNGRQTNLRIGGLDFEMWQDQIKLSYLQYYTI
jgi:hypothetical protein